MAETTPTATPPIQRYGQTALQFLVAAAAMGWLWKSGRLDFALLREQLTWQTLGLWALLYAGLNGLHVIRWRWFCRQAGMPVTWVTALKLMGLGLFWGTFTPGLVGIDVSRTYTVAKRFPGQTGPAALTVVADRLMVIIATLILSALALPWAWPLAQAHPVLLTVTIATAVAGLGLLAVMALLLYAPLERFGWGRALIEGKLARAHAALRLLRDRPGVLLAGLGLAMVSQTLTIGLIGVLLRTGAGSELSWGTLGLIVPIAWHAMSIPVAPAGLGVGQVAFDQLFVWAGCAVGVGATAATTYHACLIGFHLVCGLAWFIPEPQGRSVTVTTA